MTPTSGQSVKEVGSASPTLARLGLGFVPQHPLVSYYLWLCLILDILKICMDFGPYDDFSSSNVPEMVDQQNSWNSLVISTYLLYLAWNVGMLVVNICILWPPTPGHLPGIRGSQVRLPEVPNVCWVEAKGQAKLGEQDAWSCPVSVFYTGK
jgi:hypothetical protein